jgi:hypothetical protein
MSTTPYGVTAGSRTGTATFRLMPDHELATGTSTVDVLLVARGRALSLAYTWTHPEDGEQAGTLLLGVPGDDGAVHAAWVDSWHQPDVVALAGARTDTGARVGYEYAPGWHWEIELEVSGGRPALVMRNVVPEHDDAPGSTYDVTRTDWP